MSGFDFHQPRDALTLPEWSPLARALQRWALAHGASSTLAMLAGWACQSEAQGDSVLRLDDPRLPVLDAATRTALLGEVLCSDGERAAPFVLQGDRFYLWRNHAAEDAIATSLLARLRHPADAGPPPHWLMELFEGSDPDASAAQRVAVAAAAQQRLLLLSGGPGTGKTSTVLRILLLLQRLQPTPLTLHLAAPTGKAAQRLAQALRSGREALAARLDQPWQEVLQRLPSPDVQTLHRLLEFDPRRNRFRRGKEQRLAADVVVIDEASMVDLEQLRALLAAVPEQARLVLVGDPGQLHSVAAGAVLADIGRVLQTKGCPQWQQLEHVFRADAPLQPLLQAIRAGDLPALHAAVTAAPTAIAIHDAGSRGALAALLRRWGDSLRAWQAALPAQVDTPDQAAAALRSLAGRQLLCALREGEFGAGRCQRALEQDLRHSLGAVDSAWFHGRAVMILRNDYGYGLFNGDIGLALRDSTGRMQVWFESGEEGTRAYAPATLPAHEGAFALTIHKSQGSEYDTVAVLLPPQAEPRFLSRQLLYTGVSRAKSRVELWAGEGVVRLALHQDAQRASGLGERLLALS
ncbi:MAG TPA: exodeoxyribonuclease V subunit alpha [Arenimonas sp.]|nr:exodeoxyribonuclease V subunit alpha [Arenimonas sp.]